MMANAKQPMGGMASASSVTTGALGRTKSFCISMVKGAHLVKSGLVYESISMPASFAADLKRLSGRNDFDAEPALVQGGVIQVKS